MSSRTSLPRVLLTNDDGPPGTDSPYIYGFWRHLTEDLGWDVRVVIPSSQKSWIGKAFHIKEVTTGLYYYPKDPDGLGDTSTVSRPLRQGEVAEWVLLDGTPATCANISLHNLYPDEIDLLISGPNLGRNSSSAFALSSGTIGAALSSSLSLTRSIAVSYGTVTHPTPPNFFRPAHVLSGQIVRRLWDEWGRDAGGLRNGEVDLYSINVPMIEDLLSTDGLKICWTTMWRNTYGQLFRPLSKPSQLPSSDHTSDVSLARLDSLKRSGSGSSTIASSKIALEPNVDTLAFKFSPDFKHLITPVHTTLPVGSDGWAMHNGWVSVTPLRASFAEPESLVDGVAPLGNGVQNEERIHEDFFWKVRL